MSPTTRNQENHGFTAEDRKLLNSLLDYSKRINAKMTKLQKVVKKSHELIMEQNAEINSLRSLINNINYRADAQQQYGRREATKAYKVDGLGEDAVQIMMEVCKVIEDTAPPYKGNKVSINLQPADIHRCHFIGKGDRKKLICKFTPAAYKKKMKIMLNKKHINQVNTGKFKNFFIAEDLTQMKSHLLWFIKDNFSSKFHKVHTRNGVIKMKEKKDDTNTGNWISIDNPDDLHALVGNDFDVNKFNEGLKSFQVLSHLPAPVIEDFDFHDNEDEEELLLPV